MRQKSHRQQRLSQLKQRQNELKLELAMTKTFLLIDKNKQSEQNDGEFDISDPSVPRMVSSLLVQASHPTTSNNLSPILSSGNEEGELERDIEHLERRLATAKAQLMFITCAKK